MSDASRPFAERHPAIFVAWIALKIVVTVAVIFFLAEDDRAAILYQRF